MGQYHFTVNLSKREFLHPSSFGAGLKQWEQVDSLLTQAIYALICAPEARGGGDIPDQEGVKGRWHGDRIAVVGDYAEKDDLPPAFGAHTIYSKCASGAYADISELVSRYVGDTLNADEYIRIPDSYGYVNFVKTCPNHPDKAKDHDLDCHITTAASDVIRTTNYYQRIGREDLL